MSRILFVVLAALAALGLASPAMAEVAPEDSSAVMQVAAGAAAAAMSEEVPLDVAVIASTAPTTAAPAVLPPVLSDQDAIRAVGQIREAVHTPDWGVVVGSGCLLVVFLLVRLVLPHLHGTAGVRIVAGIAGLCGYVGAQVGPGSSVEDIIATVAIGAVLAGTAIWSPPAATSATPSNSGPSSATLGLLLVACTAGLVGCATITPAVQAGGDVVTTGYTRYVRADGTLSETQRDERIEVSCNHRRLLGLDVPAECPAVGGAR